MRSKKTEALEPAERPAQRIRDKNGLWLFQLHFLIFLIASALCHCVFLETQLLHPVFLLLLFLSLPRIPCGWGSSQGRAEMPTTGAKFNSESKHKLCLRLETLWGSPNFNFTNSLQGNISLWSSLGCRFGFLVWYNSRIEWTVCT